MQAAKRVKLTNRLEDCLVPYFTKKGKWIVLYFYQALGCDIPILESVLFSAFTETNVKDESPLFTELREFMSERISTWHPTWIFSKLSSYRKWTSPDKTTPRIHDIDILTDTNQVFLRLRSHSRQGGSSQLVYLLSICRPLAPPIVFWRERTTNDNTVRWGYFISVVEKELERFRTIEQN